MSAVEKLIAEIQEENRAVRQQAHSLTVSLTSANHDKLIKLSENLQVSKTSLASRLLTAAVEEASNKVSPPGAKWPAQTSSIGQGPKR
jgi:hypothetical protein